jgi:hypothetical protein
MVDRCPPLREKTYPSVGPLEGPYIPPMRHDGLRRFIDSANRPIGVARERVLTAYSRRSHRITCAGLISHDRNTAAFRNCPPFIRAWIERAEASHNGSGATNGAVIRIDD